MNLAAWPSCFLLLLCTGSPLPAAVAAGAASAGSCETTGSSDADAYVSGERAAASAALLQHQQKLLAAEAVPKPQLQQPGLLEEDFAEVPDEGEEGSHEAEDEQKAEDEYMEAEVEEGNREEERDVGEGSHEAKDNEAKEGVNEAAEEVHRSPETRALLSTRSEAAMRKRSCNYCICAVTSAALCGTSTVTNAAICGSDSITDGAKCGWNFFQSCDTRRRRRWQNKFKVKCKTGQTAKSCSVAKSCPVANDCDVGSFFGECFNELSATLGSNEKTYAKLITDTGCSSTGSCSSKAKGGLSSSTNLMLEKILAEAKVLATNLIGSGMPFVTNVYNKAKDLAPKVKDKAVRISSSLSEFISGALPTYSKYDLGDVCSSSNSGFWYMTPTDCELFSAMSSIDANNPQAKFTSAKDKLKTCVSKTGLLGVPTPFWDLKFAGWCLPSPVVTGLEYFMGALVWEGSAFDGTRAAIPSVQTLRTAVSEIKSLVADFASDSGIGLMELGRDVLRAREGREEDVSFRSGCGSNANWGLGLDVAFELTVAAAGTTQTFSVSLGILSGCKGNSAVLPNLILRFGKSQGATTSAGGASTAITTQIHFYESYPAFTNRFAFQASLDITPEVELTGIIGVPLAAGVPISFGIYPSPAAHCLDVSHSLEHWPRTLFLTLFWTV